MTREEAIQHFKEQLDIFGGEHAEAIKVAIEALEADITKWKTWSHTYDNACIDGTLEVKVEDATKVGRVLISDDKHRGGLYYPDEDEPQGDLISRTDAIEAMGEEPPVWCDEEGEIAERNQWRADVKAIKSVPSADRPKGEWIPVKWHEITEEEREREGYPKDWAVYIDCDMPCDGDEILVQTKSGYIRWDVCYEEGEFSLDSGWDWIEDIVAWMPLPKPYKGGEDE